MFISYFLSFKIEIKKNFIKLNISARYVVSEWINVMNSGTFWNVTGGFAEATGDREEGAAEADPSGDEGARDDVPRVDAHLDQRRNAAGRSGRAGRRAGRPAGDAGQRARAAAQVPGAGEEALQGGGAALRAQAPAPARGDASRRRFRHQR